MLNGKVTVVTGGSRGIGRAVCLKLAENGADIALLYASNEQKANEVVAEIEALGRHAVAYKCGVQSFDETAAVVAQIMTDFGHIDILVNNAGITRVAGLIGNPGQTNYSAAKAGIIGMTKSAARELAGRGICCNAVAPGFIETDMTAKFVEDKSALDKIPLKRMGKAEEVANLVFFLASPMSDYITGEVIRCDGGMAM